MATFNIERPFVILLLILIIVVVLIIHMLFGLTKHEGATPPAWPSVSLKDASDTVRNVIKNGSGCFYPKEQNWISLVKDGIYLTNPSDMQSYMSTVYVCYMFGTPKTLNKSMSINCKYDIADFTKNYRYNLHSVIKKMIPAKLPGTTMPPVSAVDLKTNLLKMVFDSHWMTDTIDRSNKNLLTILQKHLTIMQNWSIKSIIDYNIFITNVKNLVPIPSNFETTAVLFKEYYKSSYSKPTDVGLKPISNTYTISSAFVDFLSALNVTGKRYFNSSCDLNKLLHMMKINKMSIKSLITDIKNGFSCYNSEIIITFLNEAPYYNQLTPTFTKYGLAASTPRGMTSYTYMVRTIKLMNDIHIKVTDLIEVENGNIIYIFPTLINNFTKKNPANIADWNSVLNLAKTCGVQGYVQLTNLLDSLIKFKVEPSNYVDFSNNIASKFGSNSIVLIRFLKDMSKAGLNYANNKSMVLQIIDYINKAGYQLSDYNKPPATSNRFTPKSPHDFITALIQLDKTSKSKYPNKLQDLSSNFIDYNTRQLKRIIPRLSGTVTTDVKKEITTNTKRNMLYVIPSLTDNSYEIPLIKSNIHNILSFLTAKEYNLINGASSELSNEKILIIMRDIALSFSNFTISNDNTQDVITFLKLVTIFNLFPYVSFEYLQMLIATGKYDKYFNESRGQQNDRSAQRTKKPFN